MRAASCYGLVMAAPTLQELLALDVETRLALVQALWDSIVKDAQAGADLPLSEDERTLLDHRLREDDDDPGAAIPWSVARTQLHRDR